MAKKTFEQWLKEVDAALKEKCGMGYNEIADAPYGDWYAQGKAPKAAASAAIKLDRGS